MQPDWGWRHRRPPVINYRELFLCACVGYTLCLTICSWKVLSVGSYWVEVRACPPFFLFMAMLRMLILIHTCVSTFTGNRLSFREEDKYVFFFFFFSCFCVCLKKAQCGVRPGLYCTTRAFPCQQEEGCWIQVIHRCMYLCSVFGRERTQEELWSWLKRSFVRRSTWCFRTLFSYTDLTLYRGSLCLYPCLHEKKCFHMLYLNYII